jgi:hypothetical protein
LRIKFKSLIAVPEQALSQKQSRKRPLRLLFKSLAAVLEKALPRNQNQPSHKLGLQKEESAGNVRFVRKLRNDKALVNRRKVKMMPMRKRKTKLETQVQNGKADD